MEDAEQLARVHSERVKKYKPFYGLVPTKKVKRRSHIEAYFSL